MKKDKDYKEKIVKKLKQTPVVQIVCERVNISRATYYRWRKEDSEFKKETDKALKEGSMLVNDMAESQLISAIKDRSFSAIRFWLRHHHPTYAQKLEIKGHLEHSKKHLTKEEKALIRKALRLGLPKPKNEKREKQQKEGG